MRATMSENRAQHVATTILEYIKQDQPMGPEVIEIHGGIKIEVGYDEADQALIYIDLYRSKMTPDDK